MTHAHPSPAVLPPIDVVSTVARIVHETIRGYQAAMHERFPEKSAPDYEALRPWEAATEAQRGAATGMVLFMIQNPSFDLEAVKVRNVILSDVAYIAVAAARQAFAAMGLTLRPMPSGDASAPDLSHSTGS